MELRNTVRSDVSCPIPYHLLNVVFVLLNMYDVV